MKYRIKNGFLLLYSDGKFVIKKDDLFINGAVIEAIGVNKTDDITAYEVIDAENKLVMPGLINSHTHVYMNFMKNSADDLPLDSWLNNRIFPIEARMEGSDFYWSTMLGITEMIKTGTTCYLDMHICEDRCAEAARDSGIRAFMGKCLTGENLFTDSKDSFNRAIGEMEKYENGLLKFVLSPHSVYACSKKLLKQISEESAKRNMLKHIHLSESSKEQRDCISEYGCTPVEFLESIGFLDGNTIAAHCVKLTDDDIHILSKRRVNVATNPSSNAKLGNGIAPASAMMKNKINLCLGTDSAASNNTLNMFREMGVFSLLHKAVGENATDFSADTVLRCATVNPAKALGMEDKIGTITEGAYADLVFIDLSSVSFYPNNNLVSALCYSANGSEVDSLMVNGKFLMKNKALVTVDTERVYYEVNRIKNKYL